MKKYLFLLICILFFLGAAFTFYHKATTTAGPNAIATSTAENESITIATTTLKDWSTSGHYQIDFSYPVFTTSHSGSLQALNDAVRAKVEKQAADFRRNMAGMATTSPNIPAQIAQGESTLTGSGEAYMVKRGTTTAFASVILSAESDMALSAHPGHEAESVAYDLSGKRVLALKDLFVDEGVALKAVSTMAEAQVRKTLQSVNAEDAFIQEGVAPQEQNFSTFALEDAGITFVFQEYQVAPYVAGPERVTISYRDLEQYLTPDIKAKLQLD